MSEFAVPGVVVCSRLCGAGVGAARAARRWLVDALEPDQRWVQGDLDGAVVVWCSGPVVTSLVVEPVGGVGSGVAVLEVRTPVCSGLGEAEAAALVARGNRYVTINRWRAWREPGEQTFTVGLWCRFLVGDARVELPWRALLVGVAEQVSEAGLWCVARGGGSVGAGLAGFCVRRARGQWPPVVWFLCSGIAPDADRAPVGLWEALLAGVAASGDPQLAGAAAAWHGAGEASGFTCEVAFGPGPSEAGVGLAGVGSVGVGRGFGSGCRGSVVRVEEVDNPRVGRGLMVSMELPLPDEVAAALVGVLNERGVLEGGVGPVGAVHVVGSWVRCGSGALYTCMVPTAWQSVLTVGQQRAFLRGVVENCARVSWDAYRVVALDDLCSGGVSPVPVPVPVFCSRAAWGRW